MQVSEILEVKLSNEFAKFTRQFATIYVNGGRHSRFLGNYKNSAQNFKCAGRFKDVETFSDFYKINI